MAVVNPLETGKYTIVWLIKYFRHYACTIDEAFLQEASASELLKNIEEMFRRYR